MIVINIKDPEEIDRSFRNLGSALQLAAILAMIDYRIERISHRNVLDHISSDWHHATREF